LPWGGPAEGPVAEPVRLSKRVAALVPCSRREAEQYIEGGLVTVDGTVVDQPEARVHDGQQVVLAAGANLQALAPATVLLHKPAGVEAQSAIAAAGLPRGYLRHLAALMPLPAEAAGLCVFSQDRRIIRKLTEDAAFIEQEWLAEVEGEIAPNGLQRLNQVLKASFQSEKRLRLAGKGVNPAALPRLCEQVGLTVTQLRRIRLGRLPMAGLAPGQWRVLEAHERF
jgi:23S rRNA pseudouridine2604 synthase